MRQDILHRFCYLVVSLGMAGVMPIALAQQDEASVDCGNPFVNGVGPYDYTNGLDRTEPTRIPTIERFHFTPRVATLSGGQSGTDIMSDIDYTLRAVPNHHRALDAAARYEIANGGISRQWRSAECYFDRAFRFKPGDSIVWMVYGNYKAKLKDFDAALAAYTKATELNPKNVEIHYNLGLLYLDFGHYEQAVEQARIAYAKNYPLQGLRRLLEKKGYSLK